MVIKKTKISTITAAIATIAVMSTVGIMGGGIGQQQIALAQDVNCTVILVQPLSALTCVSEQTIRDFGPACDIMRIDPRLIPSFQNFPLDIIEEFCEG